MLIGFLDVLLCVSGVVNVGVHWPLSDGLFSSKWRHKGGEAGMGGWPGCVPCRKKEGGSLSTSRWASALPCNYVLLLHLPPLSSSPIPNLFFFFFLTSHSAAAPSWAAGGGNLSLSHCSGCIHTELRAGGLLPNNAGFTSHTARPHSHAHACRSRKETHKKSILCYCTGEKKQTWTHCLNINMHVNLLKLLITFSHLFSLQIWYY